MKYKRILGLALLLCLGIVTLAQETPDGYNPFVPANLDDQAKLPLTSVVESSYHYYSIKGDTGYTKGSTFVWYVENGTFGTYDAVHDTLIEATGAVALGNAYYLELTGDTTNSSGIWVRWNDGSGGDYGYIAVYERSNDNCIVTDQITGYKHLINFPPQVWFLEGTREECAEQDYIVTVQFNELDTTSYPYTFVYCYPSGDGSLKCDEVDITETDLDASFQYFINLPGVIEDITVDIIDTIYIETLRDSYGATGEIAPLGIINRQFAEIKITILHLPQTGEMTMEN